MTTTRELARRQFLWGAIGTTATAVLAPAAASTAFGATRAAGTTASLLPFVDSYRTNVGTNLSFDTNAAVQVLSGFGELWQTGDAWNTGVVLDEATLRRNMRYCARATARRTEDQAKKAFIVDRQHQSYAMIGGLGPLAEAYTAGARAVTGITSAPDDTPATKLHDFVPADAPAGSALGAGSTDSALGTVVTLVNTVRGSYSSSNPTKNTFQYPRPWRMTEDSTVVDTGDVDEFGYPVYESDVVVARQLLRQRSTSPASDGGYPSGHVNALWLAGLAFAYAVPERFQEIITRAFELGDARIVAGMHSPVDVVGGRVLATALAAAILADPANADLKTAARAQALEYLGAATGATSLFEAAHAASADTDPYADREANARLIAGKQTYVLRRRDGADRDGADRDGADRDGADRDGADRDGADRDGADREMVVPKGAEVLLETRLPYLSAEQRREVLRGTALPSGYPILDGPELWGRLDLFTAADGFGEFARDVVVTMDAARGGFDAADAWRNDIDGPGGLLKLGTGTLTLTGRNTFRGDVEVAGGTLVAAAGHALGRGAVAVTGGTLVVGTEGATAHDGYRQTGGVLQVTADGEGLHVGRRAAITGAARLRVELAGARVPRRGLWVPVLRAPSVTGGFAAATVLEDGYRARVVRDRHGVGVLVTPA